jgi:hypothetical protein
MGLGIWVYYALAIQGPQMQGALEADTIVSSATTFKEIVCTDGFNGIARTRTYAAPVKGRPQF